MKDTILGIYSILSTVAIAYLLTRKGSAAPELAKEVFSGISSNFSAVVGGTKV